MQYVMFSIKLINSKNKPRNPGLEFTGIWLKISSTLNLNVFTSLVFNVTLFNTKDVEKNRLK